MFMPVLNKTQRRSWLEKKVGELQSMHSVIRPVLATALAAAFIGGALAPMAAHAAPARGASPLSITWMPNDAAHTTTAQPGQVLTVKRAQSVSYTATFVSSNNLTNVNVKPTVSAYAHSHGVSITVNSTSLGSATSVAAGTAVRVSFTVSVAPNARVAIYNTDLHVNGSINGAAATHLANDLDLTIDVDHMSQVISWLPATAPNTTLVQPYQTIMVRRAQTMTETATFISSVALTNVSVHRTLFDYAKDHGVAVAVISTTLGTSTTLAANTPVTVTFTVSVAPDTRVAYYYADIHVDGSLSGQPATFVPNSLPFTVQAAKMSQVIFWLPTTAQKTITAAPNSTFTVKQGQRVTETGVFTSTIALSSVSVKRTLRDYSKDHGLTVSVLSTSLGSTAMLAANTPVTVTFSISVARNTRIATYHADLHVDGSLTSIPGSDVVILPNSLQFAIKAARA